MSPQETKRAKAFVRHCGDYAPPALFHEVIEEFKNIRPDARKQDTSKQNAAKPQIKKPDINKIVENIKADALLSSICLKIANSPYFFSGRLRSLDGLCTLENEQGVFHAITASLLFRVTAGEDLFTNTHYNLIWQHSMTVAMIGAAICRKIDFLDKDDVFFLSLFHDCSLPLFVNSFDTFSPVLDTSLSDDYLCVLIEENEYQVNHASASAIIARQWNLPPYLCEVIGYHHCPDIDIHNTRKKKRLAACLLLAECVAINDVIHYCSCSETYSAEVQNILNGKVLSRVMPKWPKIFQAMKLDDQAQKDLQSSINDYLFIFDR